MTCSSLATIPVHQVENDGAAEAGPDRHEAVVTGAIGEADRLTAHGLPW